jgi:hypothetical protein
MIINSFSCKHLCLFTMLLLQHREHLYKIQRDDTDSISIRGIKWNTSSLQGY